MASANPHRDIIVIGASAGSVPVLLELAKGLPPERPLSDVIPCTTAASP